MGRNFFEIAFTPSVKREQERHGSRLGYASFARRLATAGSDNALGPTEQAFVSARDGFYLSTVSETGWPYLQYRGGPAGFVKIVDTSILTWADLRGNRQYVSVGNTAFSDRVCLFFMDYAQQRRLKVYGHITVEEIDLAAERAPAIVSDANSKIEHFISVRVAGFDWNCPQHITPRFTVEEFSKFSIR